MKRVLIGLTVVGLLGYALTWAVADTRKAAEEDSGKLRHVVLFKFKDSATPEQIKEVEEAFAALPKKIPEIIDFEWGTNNSPEGLDQGLTHCFLLTFKDEAGRAVYLPHPDHKAFGKVLRPILDKVVVVDYFVK
jgi:hypothetical protein